MLAARFFVPCLLSMKHEAAIAFSQKPKLKLKYQIPIPNQNAETQGARSVLMQHCPFALAVASVAYMAATAGSRSYQLAKPSTRT